MPASIIGPGTLVDLQNVTQNFQAPLSALGAFIGGGGYITEEDIPSGTVNITANAGTAVLWNSGDLAPKTNYIPVSTGSRQIITIFDVFGNAYLYPITIVPLSGSIINQQTQIYTNFGSLTVYDSEAGWLGF